MVHSVDICIYPLVLLFFLLLVLHSVDICIYPLVLLFSPVLIAQGVVCLLAGIKYAAVFYYKKALQFPPVIQDDKVCYI